MAFFIYLVSVLVLAFLFFLFFPFVALFFREIYSEFIESASFHWSRLWETRTLLLHKLTEKDEKECTKMNAYKCDLCSGLFTVRNILKIPNSFRLELSVSNLLPDDTRPCDLCPDCINAIQAILDERCKKK